MTLLRLRQQILSLAARGTEHFGRTGWLGLALCALAAAWFALLWSRHREPLPVRPLLPVAAVVPAPVASSPMPLWKLNTTLARRSEQALLLKEIQQVTVSQGLAWAAADYKFVPASEAMPSSLEVHCTLKGPYPRLRATFVQWLRQVPGLAIRDLMLTRPNSDAPEVEAKLVLVVFLRSEGPEAQP